MADRNFFRKLADHAAHAIGTPIAFSLAVLTVLVWAVAGPIFDYSETWQLIINTGTTIITFLMIFLVQNTQNRDTRALQIKIDELLRALEPARNAIINVDELSEAEMKKLEAELRACAQQREAEQAAQQHA